MTVCPTCGAEIPEETGFHFAALIRADGSLEQLDIVCVQELVIQEPGVYERIPMYVFYPHDGDYPWLD